MATPATGALIGTPASISASVAAAHRRHRRAAVRLENVGDDADRVGELFFGRHHGRQRALGQRAVADLAPAGAAQDCTSPTENGGKL